MKLRDELKLKYEILDVLASKDKKELREASYVAYDNIIEFPKPVAFTVKALKRIIKEIEKSKPRGRSVMVGIMLEIPLPEELRKKHKGKTIITTKSVMKKYDKLK